MILKVFDRRLEMKNTFSLILKKPKDFNFYPGQYIDVKLPVNDQYGGNTRAFTIASSPTEEFLMITYKKGVSSYKKKLESIKTNDIIETSHPAGTFILDESSSAVFIAGGVGITPFRSIIKYVVDQNLSTPITLIYFNSDNNFLFKEELDKWQEEYSKLEIIYQNSASSGHAIILNTKYLIPNTIFYLAGPPEMVNNCAKILLDLGIDEINLRYDRFDGY